jgi:hypothetical protein
MRWASFASLGCAVVLATACGERAPGWSLVRAGEPAALLAAWGQDADDVWVVGGRTELAGGPAVLRLRDGSWTRLDPGQPGIDLWWVFGFPGGDVLFGGSGGAILRYRGGTFERMPTPRDGIVFGIWGAAPDDVWAVGDGGVGAPLVWRFDGTAWREVAAPAGTPRRVFKVHGRSRDDVWISCSDGSVLRWNGSALTRELTGVGSPLFSIVTTADQTIAVGGIAGTGQILARDASAGATGWAAAPLSVPVAWRGTAASERGVYAVGESGLVARYELGQWRTVDQPVVQGAFHAGWVDPAGGLWGVGGDFNRTPLTAEGFLVYYGTAEVPEVPR